MHAITDRMARLKRVEEAGAGEDIMQYSWDGKCHIS
jgi:hypothetical protein